MTPPYPLPPRYRRAALALVVAGALAGVGGVAFPDAREVLFSLAMTGLFGGVLLTLLGADRLVPNTVAELVYDSTANNEAALVEALGLSDRRIYVPTPEGVVLYVPADGSPQVPVDPTTPWSTDDEPNLVLEPTGAGLRRAVARTLSDDLEPGIETTATMLTEGLVEVLELAHTAAATVNPADGTATVDITAHSFGDVDRLDHPIASYLAVGFAREFGRPVTLEVRQIEGTAWRVSCYWDPDERARIA